MQYLQAAVTSAPAPMSKLTSVTATPGHAGRSASSRQRPSSRPRSQSCSRWSPPPWDPGIAPNTTTTIADVDDGDNGDDIDRTRGPRSNATSNVRQTAHDFILNASPSIAASNRPSDILTASSASPGALGSGRHAVDQPQNDSWRFQMKDEWDNNHGSQFGERNSSSKAESRHHHQTSGQALPQGDLNTYDRKTSDRIPRYVKHCGHTGLSQ